MDQSLERLVSPLWSFLLLFWLNSHLELTHMEAHHIYLLALASKTHARGSPRRGTLHYSSGRRWLTLTVQVLCLETLLVFHVNQVIQHLFSSKFPTTLFFPNLFIFLIK